MLTSSQWLIYNPGGHFPRETKYATTGAERFGRHFLEKFAVLFHVNFMLGLTICATVLEYFSGVLILTTNSIER
jgi:hypothetical protein